MVCVFSSSGVRKVNCKQTLKCKFPSDIDKLHLLKRVCVYLQLIPHDNHFTFMSLKFLCHNSKDICFSLQTKMKSIQNTWMKKKSMHILEAQFSISRQVQELFIANSKKKILSVYYTALLTTPDWIMYYK